MAKNRLVANLLMILILIILILMMAVAGCKDDGKRKALAEAAQARVEVVKLKAETVQLKSEISYLNEKLVAANMAKDKIQIQLAQLIEDGNATTADVEDVQQENDKLKAQLVEQTKKTGELEKQVETLRAVINALQTRIEQEKAVEQPKATEQTQTDK
jgi:chromosome segregation ATPase